jgi:NAD(P)H-hydrate repair Nnr-like enzyme with NAD(P)H-hydrate dehydratase domain
MPAFEAACAGAWIHGRAAELAGPQMIADDLVEALPRAIASLS